MVDLLKTPLHPLHAELGAKMVPFAGWEMPVQYPLGVMKEHLASRAGAGLFDVSHMGQVLLTHADGPAAAARALEALVPQNVVGLAEGRQRYAFFTNAQGGIEDDLMVARRADDLFLVVNAARRSEDLALLRAGLETSGVKVTEVTDRALLALQGPDAAGVLAAIAPGAEEMAFMDVATLDSDYGALWVSRSGYTGDDGFELSVPAGHADGFVRACLAAGAVAVGLGARDSLRLEAGLCLYGQDIGAGTTPVEAGLTWAIQKARRAGGDRAGGFPGAERILAEMNTGAARLRVGLRPEGRAPMRAGVPLFAAADATAPVGQVTSGGFGPSVGHPIAMGYVPIDRAAAGTKLWGELRGKRHPVEVVALPFRPATYLR